MTICTGILHSAGAYCGLRSRILSEREQDFNMADSHPNQSQNRHPRLAVDHPMNHVLAPNRSALWPCLVLLTIPTHSSSAIDRSVHSGNLEGAGSKLSALSFRIRTKDRLWQEYHIPHLLNLVAETSARLVSHGTKKSKGVSCYGDSAVNFSILCSKRSFDFQ